MQLKNAVGMCAWLLVTGCGEDFFDDSALPEPEAERDIDDGDVTHEVPEGSRSGVDKEHTAGDLNNAEVQSLCSWAATSYEALLRKDLQETCTLFAGGFGGSPAECSLIVEGCVQEFEAVGLPPTDSSSCSRDLADCTATVGEIEACLEQQYAALDVLLGAVSCEGGLPAEVEEAYAQVPAACLVVQAKCPAMFEDEPPVEGVFVCDPAVGDEEVPMSAVCDGLTNCDNGADELGCDATLVRFVCDDGTVIAQSSVCDGDFDCGTGEDERCP
jgi:hypothetical protein